MVGMGHAGQMRRRAQSQALLQSHSAPHALVLPWVPSPLPLLLLVLLVLHLPLVLVLVLHLLLLLVLVLLLLPLRLSTGMRPSRRRALRRPSRDPGAQSPCGGRQCLESCLLQSQQWTRRRLAKSPSAAHSTTGCLAPGEPHFPHCSTALTDRAVPRLPAKPRHAT